MSTPDEKHRGPFSQSAARHYIEGTDFEPDAAQAAMPFVIFFLLISLPVLEVASIVQVSRWVGPVTTFLLLAASVTFGAFLIRSQSFAVGRRVMAAIRAGTRPEKALLDGGMITLAGMLFIIPGFFSDILAVLLLIPAARRWMWRGIFQGMRGRMRVSQTHPRPAQPPQNPQRSSDVIDVEFSEAPRDQQGGATSAKHDDSPWHKPS